MGNIILVRHGQTAWALEGKHTGLTDIPLTKAGEKQAQELQPVLSRLDLDAVFVSPLERAKRTFLLSELPLKPIFDPDLCEWDYGAYEGMTSKEIHALDPKWSIFTKGAPHGESLEQIEQRASRMLDKARLYQGDVAFFSSGHILRSIAARFLGVPLTFADHLPLHTASISILGFEKEVPSLLLWNQTVSTQG